MSLSKLWRVVRTDPGRIMRADREVVVSALRREAGLALTPVARRGRTAMATLSGFLDRSTAAEAAYARVLDGHTLNLRLVPPEAVVAGAVVFVHHRLRERVACTVRLGGAEAVATVLLGGRLGGVPLEPGRWRVLLEAELADGNRRTWGVRLTDPGRADGGPTVPAPPCPDTGYRYQVGFSPAGALVLTVAPPEPTAELTRMTTRATGLRLAGRLLGVTETAGTMIVFTGPGHRAHAVPARIDDTAFEVVVPVASLADGPAERPWKVWADVPAVGRLRVGRFLTDLRAPQAVHRRPNRMIGLDGGAYAMVRPSYAGGGALTLVCSYGREEIEETAE